MNLGKMVNVFGNNRDGIIVNLEKDSDDFIIEVKNKYLAKNFDAASESLKYKIVNFKRLVLFVDEKYSCLDIDVIKKMQLTIIDAEIGLNHSLQINVCSRTIIKGKLYIWSDWNNDIRMYDQSNNEIEYETFNAVCREC